MNQVEYRDISGFPGYRVGDDGSVWTCKARSKNKLGHSIWILSNTWKPMIPQPDTGGYFHVRLTVHGKYHDKPVAHVVLTEFVGPKPPRMDACHDPDPCRANNRLNNLRWDTRSANIKDAWKWREKNGVPHPANQKHGQESHFAKVDNAGAEEILRRLAAGIPVKTVAKDFGLSESHVYKIRKGTTRKAMARN